MSHFVRSYCHPRTGERSSGVSFKELYRIYQKIWDHIAAVLEISIHVGVAAMHRNVTANIFAVVVPVESVPIVLKFVPHVNTHALVPEVVMAKVTSWPTTPLVPLNV